MFRFEDRQLHMVAGLLAVVSVLLFFLFSANKVLVNGISGELKGVEDFSESWICMYEVPVGEGTETQTITDVMSFPTALPAESGATVQMTHKVPDMGQETVYLILETKRQKVEVYIDNQEIYGSTPFEDNIEARHVIPISTEFKDKIILFRVTGQAGKQLEIPAIQTGTYNELLVQAISEDSIAFLAGIFLIFIGLSLFAVWPIIKRRERQKRLLLYGGFEGIFMGCFLLLQSQISSLLLPDLFAISMVKTCLIILVGVLHLMGIRYFVYKKKVMSLLDMGILFFGIFYISVMVLQAFSLISFAQAAAAGAFVFKCSVLLYIVVMAVVIYKYERKELIPVLAANVVLFLCIISGYIMEWIGNVEFGRNCEPIGFCIYILFIWVSAVKNASLPEKVKKSEVYSEEQLRAELLEQVNPNLLFASFQTLQNLIKNGSEESVKMIYYISVYVRNNLRALESAGEIISFEEELEHIIAYLKLQKTRNQNLDFAVECKMTDFKVPRYSIEPMVENAVKHGIANQGNKGNVVIRSYQRADGYAVQVVDNGTGFDINTLKKSGKTSLLYLLDMLESKCYAKSEIISKAGKGTVITIVFPMLENEELGDEQLELEE